MFDYLFSTKREKRYKIPAPACGGSTEHRSAKGKIISSTILLLILPLLTFAQQNIVNVYNWGDFMPAGILEQFEQETGIHVNYSEFDSNDTLYAKLKATHNGGYDVIVPSSYFIYRMREQGMLAPLDKTKLPNLKHLDPHFLHLKHDPNSQYSLPFLWGTTGYVVNDKYHDVKTFKGWRNFWQPELKNQLLILDEARDVFSVVMIMLGFDANDTNPEHIKQAYLTLKELLPNIKLFNSIAIPNITIDEDATISMIWSGEAYFVTQENPHLHYIYAEEGFLISIDCIAIPANAPHMDNAHKFINFVLRPDIAKKLSLGTGYITPNKTARSQMPAQVQQNPIINPGQDILKRGKLQYNIGSAAELYAKYWEQLKLSNTSLF